jgi:formylglycine-generating enzyme required for sulfatase activity
VNALPWAQVPHIRLARLAFDWCLVPAGAFSWTVSDETVIGETDGGDNQSGRAGTICLSGFEITRTPVTNAQFEQFVAAGAYDREHYWTAEGWRRRTELGWARPHRGENAASIDGVTANATRLHDRYNANLIDPAAAVTGVSWWEALAFAHWADAHLPTEAQWTYAAKGPSGRVARSALSSLTEARDAQSRDRARDDQYGTSFRAHPAGTGALPFGFADMSGTGAEWCLDNAPAGAPDGDSSVDPVYETSEISPHVAMRVAGAGSRREIFRPGRRDDQVGFRLVRPIQQAAS